MLQDCKVNIAQNNLSFSTFQYDMSSKLYQFLNYMGIHNIKTPKNKKIKNENKIVFRKLPG